MMNVNERCLTELLSNLAYKSNMKYHFNPNFTSVPVLCWKTTTCQNLTSGGGRGPSKYDNAGEKDNAESRCHQIPVYRTESKRAVIFQQDANFSFTG